MPFLSISESTLTALNINRRPRESDDELIRRLLDDARAQLSILEEIENMERE